MKIFKQHPILLFLSCFLALAIPLCLFPINLFSGKIVYNNGTLESVVEAPLSLSYFFGLGYNESDMEFVQDFYLTPSGYFTVFLLLIGIPALIAYRVHLSKSNKS